MTLGQVKYLKYLNFIVSIVSEVSEVHTNIEILEFLRLSKYPTSPEPHQRSIGTGDRPRLSFSAGEMRRSVSVQVRISTECV
jgi:hypothetical protein